MLSKSLIVVSMILSLISCQLVGGMSETKYPDFEMSQKFVGYRGIVEGYSGE